MSEPADPPGSTGTGRPHRVPRRWPVLGALVLAAVALAGWLLHAPRPAAAGPLAGGGGQGTARHTHATNSAMAGMPGMTGAAVAVQGTTASAGGYTLRPLVGAFVSGVPSQFRFQIVDSTGAPVTRFVVEWEKPLHLVIARDDLGGYQHLHPTMAPDGTWSVPLTLTGPGGYRAYADFVAQDAKGAATAAVLAAPLTVAGAAATQPLAAPATSVVLDGLTVAYQGSVRAGIAEPLLFTVWRSGTPVIPEHYLGTYGHLVVLRQADLGFLHVHPETALYGGAVKFWLAAPGPGTYRLYLDFQLDGRVHTAEFTLRVA